MHIKLRIKEQLFSEKYANMHDTRVTCFISTVVVLIVQCFGVDFMYWLHLMYIFIN